MRKYTILAAAASLALATTGGALAQSGQAPAPAPAEPPAASPGTETPQITSVNVVDIEELPEPTQQQVNQAVEQGGSEQLERLRASIDGMPHLKSALEAKGATSADVIAVSMNESGALTLVTKKAS